MTLGFTYDLKDDYLGEGYSAEELAEFDTRETIDGIAKALRSLGHRVELIGNVRSLIRHLHSGRRWDMVFNICEGLKGTSREAQVPVLLDIYDIPYVFSDGLVLALCLDKGMTKRVIRDLGIPTAAFEVVRDTADAERINLPFPLFVKPVAEGTGKGIGAHSMVENKGALVDLCIKQLERYRQPLLVEEYLSGREFTVGLIGSGSNAKVIGMMEVNFLPHEETGIYSYENKAHYEAFVTYSVPEKPLYDQCASLALKAWQGLGCLDAGRIDIRLDRNGIPNFLEVNPLAGLNPVHSDLPILARMAGIDYRTLISMIMQSAMERSEGLKVEGRALGKANKHDNKSCHPG